MRLPRIIGGAIGLAICIAILLLATGCALIQSKPRVYRLGPGEGLVIHDKDSVICAGVQCGRLWRDEN